MGLQRVLGSTWDTLDNLVVRVLADLPDADREGIVFVSGGKTVNDGGGGWFMYNPAKLRSTANTTDTIDPTGTGLGKGCWERQLYVTSPAGTTYSEVQTASAGQSQFTLQTFTYIPGRGQLSVYVNGTRLTNRAFTEDGVNKITLGGSLRLGDVVEFLKYDQPVGVQGPIIKALQVQYANTAERPTDTNLTQSTVQEAIEELEGMVSVAVGGAIPTASNISYIAQLPDISTNVQSGMKWLDDRQRNHFAGTGNQHQAVSIQFDDSTTNLGTVDVQAALEELQNRLGHGLAKDIGFDPTPIGDSTVINATNVQILGEQLYTYSLGLQTQLSDHLGKTTAAHRASAIRFDGDQTTFSFLATSFNVKDALISIADEIVNGDIEASQITVDNSTPYEALGGTVQVALENALDRYNLHLGSNVAHNAGDIVYHPRSGRVIKGRLEQQVLAANVQNAVDALEDLARQHEVSSTAHDAKDLTFTPQMGIEANSVEAALRYINQGNWRYMGHIDLTSAAPAPNPLTNAVNNFYTVPYTGPVDPSWSGRFHTNGRLPATVSGNGYVFEDATGKYWYMDMPTINNGVIKDPIAGQSQVIQTADGKDTALILSGTDDQSADLLIVNGKGYFGSDLYTEGKAEDGDGNLRQEADDVIFRKPARNLAPQALVNTVHTALLQLDYQHATHVSGTRDLHKATDVIFVPTLKITDRDVQNAIEKVQGNLDRHEIASIAHKGANISFDNGATGLSATNLQFAIDEMYQVSFNHPNQGTGAHAATAISFAATSSISGVLNVRDAIIKVDTDAKNHVRETIAAHLASAIGATPPNASYTFNQVQAALDQIITNLANHINASGTGSSHAANKISLATITGMVSNDVQQGIAEVYGLASGDIDNGTF